MSDDRHLVVIDGLDGCGKSTQLDLLDRALSAAGAHYRQISFPDYAQPSSAPVRMYLAGELGGSPEAVNAYAATQYGVTTDSGLTLGNSAYRFPASVAADASQETLEAKARDMVDYTFQQLMMQAGVDTLADAGLRCNVCIVEDGGSLLIYVLYDG